MKTYGHDSTICQRVREFDIENFEQERKIEAKMWLDTFIIINLSQMYGP